MMYKVLYYILIFPLIYLFSILLVFWLKIGEKKRMKKRCASYGHIWTHEKFWNGYPSSRECRICKSKETYISSKGKYLPNE